MTNAMVYFILVLQAMAPAAPVANGNVKNLGTYKTDFNITRPNRVTLTASDGQVAATCRVDSKGALVQCRYAAGKGLKDVMYAAWFIGKECSK